MQPFPGQLHVVAVISNPVRYRTRYLLYRDFEKHMLESGVNLITVELATGGRAHEVTHAEHPNHLQLRNTDEYWVKENLINLGISRLPKDWKYVAWIDADVRFARPDWAQETLHQLQHHPVVQLFAEAIDLGPDYLPVTRYRSFGWSHIHGIPRKNGSGYGGGCPEKRDPGIAYYHHPGFAWAMRREAFDTLGGLADFAVVGEADYIMARSLVGEADRTLYPGVAYGYRKAVLAWQRRARELRGDVGYVGGTLLHYWHGRKADRQYWTRCRILVESGFDPSVHLKRDWQGLWQLDPDAPQSELLRDRIRAYFRSRNEDAC